MKSSEINTIMNEVERNKRINRELLDEIMCDAKILSWFAACILFALFACFGLFKFIF
jgi:hypothetical protein